MRALALVLALAAVAEAAPCVEPRTLLDAARLARDSHDSLYGMLRDHDARMDALIDAYVSADAVPSGHGGATGAARGRLLAGGQRCEAGETAGDLIRAEGGALADVELAQVGVVVLAQWQTIEATTDDSGLALGLDRVMVGGRVMFDDWVSVTGAYVSADRPRGGRAAEAAARLGFDHIALGLASPRYGVGADVIVDTEGRLVRTRLLSAGLPVPLLDGEAYFSTGWRRPQDEFFVRAEATGLAGIFALGADLVPGLSELRSAWFGAGHTWRADFGRRAAHAYVGVDGRLTTFSSAAVRALTDNHRAGGASARAELGVGAAWVQVGVTAGLRYNDPDNLEALPMLTGQVELEGGVVIRLGL